MPSVWAGAAHWTFSPSGCFQHLDGSVGFNSNGDSMPAASSAPVCHRLDCGAELWLSGGELPDAEQAGLYIKTALARGERPIYQSESGRFFIYYWRELAAWRLGESPSASWAALASRDGDAPYCPDFVAS
ncbi:unnamed protein product, partial [Prorocentrum cordatum]